MNIQEQWFFKINLNLLKKNQKLTHRFQKPTLGLPQAKPWGGGTIAKEGLTHTQCVLK